MKSRYVGALGAITALGIFAITFIGGWEGLRLTSYKDIVGVWTACYGSTAGIRAGMKFTKPECDALFLKDLVIHEAGMRRCLGEKTSDALPDKVYVAMTSLTYNIGVGAFCKSTARRRLIAGDLKGACEAGTWFNKAGGKVSKGLKNRRLFGLPGLPSEYQVCMEGVAAR